uniref:Uncharacterized protein n=1 Tax=Elizabethkingia anophelis TaxID=1117645 RepID=A0A455ZCY4_9FLAO|nr:TPA_exp: hypothetical protein [Elizabethkingia anophelis]DAC74832.1 TPA_exp: hypothetical protein [Elizabethkingia anophelis]
MPNRYNSNRKSPANFMFLLSFNFSYDMVKNVLDFPVNSTGIYQRQS